ncbi:MAG: tRNA preQ1(34) S-adenosylmethionine ribosyltransferase-isomerase QueA [Bacteriovoracaceae bacterium]|nr:tRNA preQ1(34) S-adenosylmethionine ribosyltransferase-isomerase QueA [Bacteriovoracaceae bacterium]
MTRHIEKNLDFNLSSYLFDLPTELIADRPVAGRDGSKLMVYNAQTGEIAHTSFRNLGDYLPQNSTLVMNQSKVFPCRLFGQKSTGGKAEFFILSLMADAQNTYPVMIGSGGKKQVGDEFFFGDMKAQISEVTPDGTFRVKFDCEREAFLNFLNDKAQIPIPPYIRNGIADEKDREDYQTIYAKELGSVAAPTAGLHFTQDLFNKLESQGIKKAFVTLHVGMGTFQPVKTQNILEHKMHSESFAIDTENLQKIQQKNLIAVGTTSLRVLESCYENGTFVVPENGSTQIFLHPGKEVKSIQGLITNFHLPGSSLLMLVSSLIGRQKTLELYQLAIEHKYRFFSYGDAMLILR